MGQVSAGSFDKPHICLLHYILQIHYMLIIWVVVL